MNNYNDIILGIVLLIQGFLFWVRYRKLLERTEEIEEQQKKLDNFIALQKRERNR